MQALRDLQSELEHKYAGLQDQLQQKQHPLVLHADDRDFCATRDALLLESKALRQRNDAFLRWECRVNLLVGRQEDEKEAFAQELTALDAPVLEKAVHKPFGLVMKQPLTIEECHTVAQKAYAEIEAFTQCADYVSTGVNVFGWTDRRCVEDGLLKFSLQKTFSRSKSAFELISCTWSMVHDAESYEKLFSANMNMRCEHVQRIDESNILFFHEFEVSGGIVLTVTRCLALATLFETQHGYITLFYAIDPNRLERWPEDREPVEGMTIKYQWQQMYDWSRTEMEGESCKCSYAGSVPAKATGIGLWMVEVLLQVLRWESLAVGPLVFITNESDSTEATGSSEDEVAPTVS